MTTTIEFPATLQPIISQGFLQREFAQAIRSKPGYRACADHVDVATGIGELVLKTRAGLQPLADDDQVPSAWGIEQYAIMVNLYAATTDLHVLTERVGVVSQFLQNAYVNGEQAARSLDELCRNVLFAAYLAGNTRVRKTLLEPADAIAVDDIRGFQFVFIGRIQRTVSDTSIMTVSVGSNTYQLVDVIADAVNVSTAPRGVSGVLVFSEKVSVGDGEKNTTVRASTGSIIVRPEDRGNTALLLPTDTLTASRLLAAVAKLRINAVPQIDGAYNCYLDPVSARQLFADPEFKQFYQNATSANQVFKQGMTNAFLGIRFIPTTAAFVQSHPLIEGLMIRRVMICGQGALVEGDFSGMKDADIAPAGAIVAIVDGIAMVTRAAIDRLQQVIVQSWYWIGGFSAPVDLVIDATLPPGRPENAAYKRAVIIEHIG